MNYLSINQHFRRTGAIVCGLLLAGLIGCQGPQVKEEARETATDSVNDSPNDPPKDSLTLSMLEDGTRVWKTPRTVVVLSKEMHSAGYVDYKLDGDAMFLVRHDSTRPFILRTRNLIITVLAPNTRFHVDAFASSPGEQVDLLAGKLRVIKSYHSSTDNESESLLAGEMVMINRDIDLMEKEKLDSAEKMGVEKKFPLSAGAPLPAKATPRN